MKALLTFVFALGCLNQANAIYVKTYLTNVSKAEKTCCIKLAHIYYTNNHEYIVMGKSFASIDKESCCEIAINEVQLDLSSLSQFQKQHLDDVIAFNESGGIVVGREQELLKYRLAVEGKKGKIEVSQNPISGKLILSFTAIKAGRMNLSVEPIDNNNSFYEEVEVKEGKNELEIDYVPFSGPSSQTPFITYSIVLLCENEVLGATYQHQFR